MAITAVHLDLAYSHIGMETLDLDYLEMSRDLVVATENFELLFSGLTKLNKHELKKPKYRDSIKRRIENIGNATGVSCEALMGEMDAIFLGTDYSAENFLKSIGDLIRKIIDWVVNAIKGFFGRIKRLFTNGTVRKAKVATTIAIVESATSKPKATSSATKRPESYNPPPEIINCTLPGITALICHSKKMTPKPGYKFNSDGLRKAAAQTQADILDVVDKLSGDLEIYLNALTGIANLQPEALTNGLNQISTQLAKAGGLRGLANNRFSAAGFKVVPTETNSSTGYMGVGYKLVSDDALINSWKQASTEFTMPLRDFVPDLSSFSENMTRIDSRLGVMAGKIDSSSAIRTLKSMDRVYEANKDAIESKSQTAVHKAITDRLNLVSTLVSMILRNVDTLAFYHDRFSNTYITVFSLIASELKDKQAD